MNGFGRVLLAIVAGACFACTSDVTQLLVWVNSDMKVNKEVRQIDVNVFTLLRDDNELRQYSLTEEVPPPNGDLFNLPFSFGIKPPYEDSNNDVTIRFDSYRNGPPESPMFTRKITIGFIEQKRLQLDVFLFSHCINDPNHIDCGETRVDESFLDEFDPKDNRPVDSGVTNTGTTAPDGGQ